MATAAQQKLDQPGDQLVAPARPLEHQPNTASFALGLSFAPLVVTVSPVPPVPQVPHRTLVSAPVDACVCGRQPIGGNSH